MSRPSRLPPVLNGRADMASPPADVQGAGGAPLPGRRNVLRALTVSAFLAPLFPWRRAEAKKVGISLDQVAALKEVGGSAFVTVKGQELLLVRDSKTTVHAVDPMCTHKKCKVFYRPKDNDIGCKCHKSKFTLDGEPVAGPAPRPLGRFAAKLKGDKIIIKLD